MTDSGRAVPSLVALVAAVGLLLGPLLLAGPAHAHTRSASYARWAMDGHEATVTLQVSLLDTQTLVGAARESDDDDVGGYVQQRLTLAVAGQVCQAVPRSFTPVRARYGHAGYEWRVRCARDMTAGSEVHLHSALLFAELPGHVHYAVVEHGGHRAEVILTHGERRAVVTLGRSPVSGALRTIVRFIRLGIEHILSGWDHLLFVLVLLCASQRVRQVVVVVTGFTIGHSVTLGLAATGYLSADMAGVEALIGLSIALVAVDGAWLTCARESLVAPVGAVALLLGSAVLATAVGPRAQIGGGALLGLALFAACYFALLARVSRPMRWRAAVAALFGLLHGFGFAGALAPLSESTPLPALFGFNLGVEIGQLAVVALAWPVFALARRRLGAQVVTLAVSTAGVAIGLALFYARGFS